MITEEWNEILEENGFNFLVGVPASELSSLFNNQAAETIIATREDEAIGIACGLSLGGEYPLVSMQSSGLGNIVNILASLVIPYSIPMMIIISRRGGEGEQNNVQNIMGSKSKDILDVIGLNSFVPKTKDELISSIKMYRNQLVGLIVDHKILKS